MYRIILILNVILTLCFSSDNKKLAQTGFQFLSVNSDARGGGMADAMTSSHNNSVSMFFNPAGLSRQFEFSESKADHQSGRQADASHEIW